MDYISNWEETKKKFIGYWKQENKGRPMMQIIARKPEIERYALDKHPEGGHEDVFCQGLHYNLPKSLEWKDVEDQYTNAQKIVDRYRDFCEKHIFLGDSFPNVSADFGPGSLAAYLGSDVEFRTDTVWIKPFVKDWESVPPFRYDPGSAWFQRHLDVIRRVKELVKDDIYVNMPDLLGNLDLISAMRGATETGYDLSEDPEEIKERIGQITEAYFAYFHDIYDVIKDKDGGNSYTCFQIWAPGTLALLSCDYSAMISPDTFSDLVMDSLREQADKIKYTLYHLDGADAVRHVDSIMTIDGINALQWTSGNTGPDGTFPQWDGIYDRAVKAGKSLWIKVYSGEVDDWIVSMDRIVKRYGSGRLFFFFPEVSYDEGMKLMDYAETHWCDVMGELEM